jgi:hypothetical protein
MHLIGPWYHQTHRVHLSCNKFDYSHHYNIILSSNNKINYEGINHILIVIQY